MLVKQGLTLLGSGHCKGDSQLNKNDFRHLLNTHECMQLINNNNNNNDNV